jgi:hypothetical protein
MEYEKRMLTTYKPKEQQSDVRLPNEELHKFYPSPNIIKTVKARCPRCAGHASCMENATNAYTFFVSLSEKRQYGRPKRIRQNNIKSDLGAAECMGRGCTGSGFGKNWFLHLHV